MATHLYKTFKINEKIEVTYEGITEECKVSSTTRDGVWFEGKQIDRFFNWNEVEKCTDLYKK